MVEMVNENFLIKIKSEIVRLEKLRDLYLKRYSDAKNPTDKAYASIHEKLTGENLDFLYDLLKCIDLTFDGKRFC